MLSLILNNTASLCASQRIPVISTECNREAWHWLRLFLFNGTVCTKQIIRSTLNRCFKYPSNAYYLPVGHKLRCYLTKIILEIY